MIDPVNLILRHKAMYVGIKRPGTSQIVTERLFDDHPRPRRLPRFLPRRQFFNQSVGGKLIDDRGEKRRGNRQIEQSIARQVGLAFQLVHSFRQSGKAFGRPEIDRLIRKHRGEFLPLVVVRGFQSAVFLNCFAGQIAKLIVGVFFDRHAENGELLRQKPSLPQREKRRNNFAPRQIAGGPEQHQCEWLFGSRRGDRRRGLLHRGPMSTNDLCGRHAGKFKV